MKKILTIACATVMAAAALTGCNAAKNAGSTASDVASDVAGGTGSAVSSAGEGVSKIADDAGSMMEDKSDNGRVSDGDGMIGDEEHTTEEATTVTAADQ